MSIFQVGWSLKMKTNKKVLAIKYRPQVFDELVGQNITIQAIKKSISLNKIPNAFLFTGIRGVGKTTIARILAKSLNCSNPNINNCSDTKQVTVNVFESVSANAGEDVTVCLDDNTVTLTAAASSGGDQFLWSTGETTSSIIVSPEVDTEYTVTVYNELDYDTDEVMVFVNDCIDTEVPDDSESLEFLVYPNPTFGDLNIKITGLLNVSSIHLYDLSGKALYSETISDGEEHTYIKTLNLSNFAAGIYLLKLVDNQNVITKKIVLR